MGAGKCSVCPKFAWLPEVPWVIRFSALVDEPTAHPCSVWALGIDLTVCLGGSFHSLKFSHNTCSDQYLRKHLREPLCRYPGLFLCQNSPPCHPALWNLAASVSSTQGLWVPIPRLCADAWQFSLENQLGQSQSLSQLFLSSQGSLSWLCLDKYPEPVVFQLLSPLHFLCFLFIRTFYFLHWPLVSLNLFILSFKKILCTSVLDFGGLIWLLMKFLFLQLCV